MTRAILKMSLFFLEVKEDIQTTLKQELFHFIYSNYIHIHISILWYRFFFLTFYMIYNLTKFLKRLSGCLLLMPFGCMCHWRVAGTECKKLSHFALRVNYKQVSLKPLTWRPLLQYTTITFDPNGAYNIQHAERKKAVTSYLGTQSFI